MSNALSTQGTKFYYWVPNSSSAGGAWSQLAEVTGINLGGRTKETIDVTTLDTTGGYREFIGGFRDGGTCELAMNFTAATFAIVNAQFESNAKYQYKIVAPDTVFTGMEFDGIVTDSPVGFAVGEQIKADVTIKVSGQITMTTGAVV
jgi:predicted secreted protein